MLPSAATTAISDDFVPGAEALFALAQYLDFCSFDAEALIEKANQHRQHQDGPIQFNLKLCML